LTTIIVVAYCWSKGTFQSYASSINKYYYYYTIIIISSLVYITDEMCHTDFSNKAPLFRVSFSLEEPDLVFTPTLNFNDEAEEESLCSQLKEIIEDITDMGVKIKRVAKRTENTYKVSYA
jgi:hypothetical protein